MKFTNATYLHSSVPLLLVEGVRHNGNVSLPYHTYNPTYMRWQCYPFRSEKCNTVSGMVYPLTCGKKTFQLNVVHRAQKRFFQTLDAQICGWLAIDNT